MSDETEQDWLPRELRGIWSALVAVSLSLACLATYWLTRRYSEHSEMVAGVPSFFFALLFGQFVSPYRCLGFAPPLSLAVMVCGVCWWVAGLHSWAEVLFGFAIGGIYGGCLCHFRRFRKSVSRWDDRLWPSARLAGWALVIPIMQLFVPLVISLIGLDVVLLNDLEWQWRVRLYLMIASAILCVWCWLRFLRPFVELCLEPLARLLYRVRAKGELAQFQAFGPCLVIANHAFWFDPCVLGMILPRPVTPIMTARFYNVWFIRPLLKYVFRVIVVPETAMKRDTPEVDGAIAALERGEVVVIFPEGYLRRKEVPLRRFGQGVWRILAARPSTPVVPCWIEGGWGSKFSYKDGPPGAKGKKMDLRRKIDVGVGTAEVVPTEVLASGIATRIHLMNRVSAARQHLGLPPLPSFELPAAGESAPAEESA